MLRELALLLPLLLCFAAGSPPPALAASDFERLVRSLERDLDLEREHIPAKWLVNTALFFTRSGVKKLDFVTFENLRSSDDGLARNFLRTVRQNVGSDWSPWVSTWSRLSGERTAIYARPAGKNWELLIATIEPGEATLLRIRVNKGRMMEYLSDHGAVLSDTERRGD